MLSCSTLPMPHDDAALHLRDRIIGLYDHSRIGAAHTRCTRIYHCCGRGDLHHSGRKGAAALAEGDTAGAASLSISPRWRAHASSSTFSSGDDLSSAGGAARMDRCPDPRRSLSRKASIAYLPGSMGDGAPVFVCARRDRYCAPRSIGVRNGTNGDGSTGIQKSPAGTGNAVISIR